MIQARWSRAIAVVGFAVVISSHLSSAQAQVKPDPAAALSDADKARALSLYEQGKTQYDLGEYDVAIARFKAAYEISGAPLLIFNIAQSYRRNGDCSRALDGYRHFLRLDPSSSLRVEAEAHVRTLGTRCPTTTTTSTSTTTEPRPEAASALASTAPLPPASNASRKRASLVLLGSGAALLAVGGALAIWNHQRFGRWSDEDRRLSLPPPGGDRQAQEWIDRQNRNDSLLQSIRRANYGTISVGVTSLACLLVAGAMPAWF